MAVTIKKPPTLKQQQLKDAAAQAAAALSPTRLEIQKQIAKQEADRVAGLHASEGITRALGELSAGDGAAARGAYLSAADRVASYAKGFTGSLGATQQGSADEVSRQIARLGSPGGPVTSTSGDNMNIAYQLGGATPAGDLASQAAYALTNLGDRRYAGGLRIADAGLAQGAKDSESIGTTRQKLLDLEAKRPGLIQEALSNIQKAYNAKRATDTQIGYLQLQQAKTKSQEAVAYTNLTGTLHVVRNGQVVDTGRPAVGSDGVIAATKAANAQTANEIAQQRADTARIAANAAANAAQIKSNKNEIDATKTRLAAENTFRAKGREIALQLIGVAKVTGKPLRMPPRKAALVRAIFNTYGAQLVGKYGLTQPQVMKWANEVVSSFPNDWWSKGAYKASDSADSSGSSGSGYSP